VVLGNPSRPHRLRLHNIGNPGSVTDPAPGAGVFD
jgi:hypothetical protein